MSTRRFIITITFTAIVFVLYQFVDINLFTVDLPRRVSSELFKSLREDPSVETDVVIFDIDDIPLDSLKNYIEKLKSLEPKAIGINLCNVEGNSHLLNSYILRNKSIIACGCDVNFSNGTSAIITSQNVVTHFKSDKNSYFEMQLSGGLKRLRDRGNRKERINFRTLNLYFNYPLSEIDNVTAEIVNSRTVLIGTLRETLVTPINEWYGHPGEMEGDMSEVQISANIISTINRNEFIDEVHPFLRALIILTVGLICAVMVKLVWTKYNVLNIALALIILVVLNGISSYVIVFAFSKNYYLELNEMALVTIVCCILSVFWNVRDRQNTTQNPLAAIPVSHE